MRFVGRLWRAGYDVVALCQPNLGRHRSRGVLFGLALLTGAPRVRVLDSREGGEGPVVGRRAAAIDSARWLALRAFSAVIASAATVFLTLVNRRESRKPLQPNLGSTTLYLRTDIELALAPLRAGGSLAHTEGILSAMVRKGFVPMLWSTGELAGLSQQIQARRLPVVQRANVPGEIAELLSGLRQAVALANSHVRKPAFVYQRYSLNNLAGLVTARRLGVPLVLEANAAEVKWRLDWSTLAYRRTSRACERFLLRGADRVLAVSDNAARDLVAAGADPRRVQVVPNAVEVDRFARANPVSLTFPSGSFVICFAGLFYPWHGVRHLAAAFVHLHARHPDCRLLLIGDGEDASLVRSDLDQHGLLSMVSMPGLVERQDVPAYLAAADVVVSPHANVKNFIGSPIKLFEYMASGRAIVASRVAQLGQVLRDRETALLVPPEDPLALAAALAELRADPDLRARLGSAAQAEARTRHSWDARLWAILDAQRTP